MLIIKKTIKKKYRTNKKMLKGSKTLTTSGRVRDNLYGIDVDSYYSLTSPNVTSKEWHPLYKDISISSRSNSVHFFFFPRATPLNNDTTNNSKRHCKVQFLRKIEPLQKNNLSTKNKLFPRSEWCLLSGGWTVIAWREAQ